MNGDRAELKFVEGGRFLGPDRAPLETANRFARGKVPSFRRVLYHSEFHRSKESVRAKGANRELAGHFSDGWARRNCRLYCLLGL